jgi:hypothetical protein
MDLEGSLLCSQDPVSFRYRGQLNQTKTNMRNYKLSANVIVSFPQLNFMKDGDTTVTAK